MKPDRSILISGPSRTGKTTTAELLAARYGIRKVKIGEEFRKLTIAMQVAQISGAVEANRLKGDGSLAQTFLAVREQAEQFKARLGEIAEVIACFVRRWSAWRRAAGTR